MNVRLVSKGTIASHRMTLVAVIVNGTVNR